MDKTLIETRKAEVKELSKALYYQLKTISVIYPFSEGLSEVFAEDMFLKPNTTGFIHVMHHLFTILDLAEFKKRFYWPVLDKQSENDFRTASVQYLNYLNKKHNRGWTEIKSFLVVIPGGHKFISFLMDFIDLVASEETKNILKNISSQHFNVPKIVTSNHINLLSKKIETVQNCMMEKIVKLEEERKVLKDKRNNLNKLLKYLFKKLNVKYDEINFADFFKYFEEDRNIITKEINDCYLKMKSLGEPLNEITEEIKDFSKVLESPLLIKEALINAQNKIKSIYREHSKEEILLNNQINNQTLFTFFSTMLPEIATIFMEDNQKNEEILANEEIEISNLLKTCQTFENELSNCEISLGNVQMSSFLNKTPNQLNISADDSLKADLLYTPLIKIEINEIKKNKPRLALLEESDYQSDSYCLQNQTVLHIPQTVKKNQSLNRPAFSHSKNFNPSNLLKTMSKKKKKIKRNQENLSKLASKWKENESIMTGESSISDSKQFKTVIGKQIEDMITPKKEEQKSDIYTPQKHIKGIIESLTSPVNIIYTETNTKTSSFILNQIKTSPSGRLESPINFESKQFSKLFSTDSSFVSHTGFLETSCQTVGKLIYTKENSPKNLDNELENNMNISNFCDEFFNKLKLDENEELLLNVSDTVLNEIS